MTTKRAYERIKSNPEKYAELLRKTREKNKARYERIKSDPERYANHLQKVKEYREANRDRITENLRKFYASNKEQYSERMKKYRSNGYNHDYYLKNIEEIRRYNHNYSKLNPEKRSEISRRRRNNELNALGSHTESEWRALCVYYMNQCLSCGDVPDKLTRDHIIPLARGGSDDISNIQPLCQSCNSRKNTKAIDYRIL